MTATITSHQCFVCEGQAHEPVTILGAAICNECEARLTKADPLDPSYDRYVDRFRIFWEGVAEAAASLE